MSRPYKQTLSFIRVVNARWSAERGPSLYFVNIGKIDTEVTNGLPELQVARP